MRSLVRFVFLSFRDSFNLFRIRVNSFLFFWNLAGFYEVEHVHEFFILYKPFKRGLKGKSGFYFFCCKIVGLWNFKSFDSWKMENVKYFYCSRILFKSQWNIQQPEKLFFNWWLIWTSLIGILNNWRIFIQRHTKINTNWL